MSPIGHSLIGATIAATLWYKRSSLRVRTKFLCGTIVAANLPDLPFPYWGHTRYDISHSIFSGMTVVVFYTLLARLTSLRNTFSGNWRFIAAGTLAIYSHYFLDTLYNHGKGMAPFWPFSEARVALPITWLAHMQLEPLFSSHNLTVWTIEFAVFGSLSAMILLTRSLFRLQRSRHTPL